MIPTGVTLTGPTRTITREPMKVVTALMRDPNRIHFDPAAASGAGLGDRLVNQGPLSATYVMQDCLGWFGQPVSWSADLTYRANALEGDRTITTATVTQVTSSEDGLVTHVAQVRLSDHAGRSILDGTITWTSVG